MELDEDREPIPDAETMEFYRIGPPVPSILRKPGSKRRLEASRRVSFSRDVSEGSTESLPNELRCSGPPPGRTLRKKQSVSVIAFCSLAMVTLVGVFWGYIIHGIVHAEGVTPSPPYRHREYVKASPAEEVLRNLEDSDYAVPNRSHSRADLAVVFLTERSKRRRVRTPVVVLRRHPQSESSSPWVRRATGRPPYRFRRSSPGLTSRRRRPKTTRRTVFQWRSRVLATPGSTTDASGPPVVQDNALFPETEVSVLDELSNGGTPLAAAATMVANDSDVPVHDNATAWVGASTEEEEPVLASAGDDGDDSAGSGGDDASSNALLSEDEVSAAHGQTSRISSPRSLDYDGANRDRSTTADLNETVQGPMVNSTDVEYYE